MKLPWVLWSLVLLAALAAGAKLWFDRYGPSIREISSPPREAAELLKQIWAYQNDLHVQKVRDSSAQRPAATFGTLRQVIDHSKIDQGYKWESESTMEHHEYLFRLFLPQSPGQPDSWCAIAWPARVEKIREWPCFLITQGNSLYISSKSLGRSPQVSDIFEAAPFASRVAEDKWTLRQ